jgi:oxygen-independent coproporphyrinogen-3 oxidase
VKALCKEIFYYGAHCRDYVISTVYIGGGTPSWLWESDMAAILDAIQKSFSLLPEAEVSIECNPGTVTAQKFAVYRQSGINRISLGLQSAQNVELKMLGRIHTWEQFLKTYELARSGGFSNINVDLMSSLPGQHIETYADSLQKVCRLKPEHISAYSLIIEKGTPFYDLYKFDAVKQRAGMVTDALPTEDEVYEMTKLTEEMLKENGYVHYEVSNFAQPGYACRHNIGYWTRVNYLGMGLGASSLMENIRYTNTSDLYTYLEQVDVIREGIWENKRSDGTIEQLPATNLHASAELVGKYAQMEEFMYLGLRMIDGISRDDFFQSFGMPIEAVYQEVLNHLQEEKLLERRAGRIYLTPKGQDVSNYALAQFLFDETS